MFALSFPLSHAIVPLLISPGAAADMGKYTRKPKTSGDVSALGVRTRAKILALQRLRPSSTADASLQPSKLNYLELRSRRLEKPKPTLLSQHLQNSRTTPAPKQGFVCEDKQSPRIESSPEKLCCGSSFSSGQAKDEDECLERQSGGFRIGDSEIEVSLGENDLDIEFRERSTRESSPCSFVGTTDAITTPGSSTKQRSPTVAAQRSQDALQNIPSAREVEEFFALIEQPQQRLFIEKYNFDIVNDGPLPGHYEWVTLTP